MLNSELIIKQCAECGLLLNARARLARMLYGSLEAKAWYPHQTS